jgi:hypothetical protein
MKSIKSIKLDSNIKYIFTLLIILFICYITYYFYKNNYETFSNKITNTLSKNSDTEFKLSNIGTQSFNVLVRKLGYDKTNDKIVETDLKTYELDDGENVETGLLPSGNIGYSIILYSKNNVKKDMQLRIELCPNKDIANCNKKLKLLTLEDLEDDIYLVDNTNSNSQKDIYYLRENNVNGNNVVLIGTKGNEKSKRFKVSFYVEK